MNYKILIILFLAIICFLNNLLINFDVLQEITENAEVSALLIDKSADIKPKKYFKMLYRYLVYYVYFYDPYSQLTIFELITLGG